MRKRMTAVLGAMVCALAAGTAAQAAVADNAVSQAYNAAVRLEDQLDGFSVNRQHCGAAGRCGEDNSDPCKRDAVGGKAAGCYRYSDAGGQ